MDRLQAMAAAGSQAAAHVVYSDVIVCSEVISYQAVCRANWHASCECYLYCPLLKLVMGLAGMSRCTRRWRPR